MRTLALWLTLAGFTFPAFAAKRVTIDELEQTLSSSRNLPDAEVAKKLSGLELTYRLSQARLDRLETEVPGEKARQALMILADASTFLDPPAGEIPAQPTPDVASQRKILALTVKYVAQAVHQLPNLFATRVTTSFEDTPAVQRPGAISTQGAVNAPYQPIHLVGDSKVTVSFRDGREVVEKGKLDPVVRRLTTAGVFGPILGTVLVDAARSKLAWSHWEAGKAGIEAVFSYEVPKDKSHYTITYDSIPGDQEAGGACSRTPQTFTQLVAYHGEMAIDPASGTILRLMLLADLKPGEFTVKSGIAVEYEQVNIGGKPYFLPVRNVNYSLAHSLLPVEGDCLGLEESQGLKTSLNDVVFEDYHVFRGDAKMLTESEAAKLESQLPGAANDSGSKQTEKASAPPTADATSALPGSQVAASAGAGADSSSTVSAARAPALSSSTTAGALTPQSDTSTAAGQATQESQGPDGPAPSAAPAPTAGNSEIEAEQEALLQGMPVYRTNARDVVLDVVVTKSNGDPVPGLGRKDFEVKEDGKPQAVDFLEEHTAAAPEREVGQSLPKLPPGNYTNAPPVPVGDSVNVLLLDTLNTPQQDQGFVHNEIRDFLKTMQPGTRVAIFALGSKLRFVQGFTTDTAVLLEALKGAAPVKELGARDRGDQADDAADAARLTMMQSMGVGALQAAQADMSSFDFGKRASITFEALDHLALYLAGIPGRKNLIWFSSSFPVVIFPSAAQRASMENSPNMRGYLNQAKKTADRFTVSQVSIYPVSAEGMITEHTGEADSAGAGAPEGSRHFGGMGDGAMSNGTMEPYMAGVAGRANTVAAMEQLASSTGGKAYYNTNDLNAALQRAINDGAHYYTLSYSPANAKMDGTYRGIEIHVTKGHYSLAYRRGYNADSASSLEAASGTRPGNGPATDPLASEMKLGLPSATGLFYGMRVVPATRRPPPNAARAGQNPKLSGSTVRYNVDFLVRLTDLTFQAGPKGEHDGRIEVGLMAYDHDGSAVNWDGVTQAVHLQPAAYDAMQKSGLRIHMRDRPA